MSARPPEELIERHEAFLALRPVDRPLLGLWMGGYYPADQFPIGTSHWADGQPLRPDDVRFDAFADDYERLHRLHRDVDDDFFFVGSAYWGVPWLEAILGCPVHISGASCRAVPAAPAGARDGDAWVEALLQFTRDLIAFANGRFPVCAPLLRGPGDCASAMLGAMDFVTACVDEPARVAELAERAARARSEVVRRLDEVVPAWHGTHAAGGYPSKMWSRRTVGYCQEDSAALLNPGLFRKLLMPLHRRIARETEVSFIHLHSACLYPVEVLLEQPNYTVIEVNLDHAGTGPPLERILTVLRRVQEARHPLLLWGHFGASDWELVHTGLSPVGLSLQPIATSAEDVRVAMQFR